MTTTGGEDPKGKSTIQGDIVYGDKISGDKVMGDKYEVNIFQSITNFFAGDTEQQCALRNRQDMLQLVWSTWIEGVLKKSLYNEMLIDLGMETKPYAIEHTWIK